MEADNPSIEKQRFLQPNKNLLWGVKPNLENINQRPYHNYNQSIQIYLIH